MYDSGQQIKDLADGGASAVEVSAEIESSQQNFSTTYALIAAAIASAFVLSASRDSKNKTEGAIARSFNVPRETVTILDAQQLDDIQQAAIAENVQLIKTIPSQYFNQIAQAVSANFSGRPQTGDADSLAGRIQQVGRTTTKRSQFIARDQTAKVTSAVTESRHKAVGIKKYKWRNSQDQRVVGNPSGLYPKGNKGHGNHWVRENKVFYYARPPFDGNPGQAYNCRCTAEAVLDTDDMDVVFSA
jgi:SPP1 gp7 family putative phage head morphogenesis protein